MREWTTSTRRTSRRRALRALAGGLSVGLAGRLRSGSDGTALPNGDSLDSILQDGTRTLTAGTGSASVPPDETYRTWLYGDRFPGPEIRAAEGETLRIDVENRLPEGTTVHWHGVPVPNPMDGVPGVTQEPIEPDGSFSYEFDATPPGTYVYHSHVGLQLDRGLYGPLIVEEDSPHVDYDREYTLLVDDYLPDEPRLEEGGGGPGPGGGGGPGPDGNGGGGPGGGGGGGQGPGGGGSGPGGNGGDGPGPGGNGGGPGPGGGGSGPGDGGPGGTGPGGQMGGQMGGQRPPYEGLLINGRLPDDPPEFAVEEGERVRLRFVNPSSATTYRVAVGGHPLRITHADGRPVEPVEVDAFDVSMGERYDAVLDADAPGAWAVVAVPVDGDERPARGILRYEGADGESPTEPDQPERVLEYGDLVAVSPLDGLDGEPDRTFDFALAWDPSQGAWTIGGQAYPDADRLTISEGEHVRVRMGNRSPMIHPMHLHGHFFRVGDAVKDTVLVPPHMGRVEFDFVADNPGDWLFHCHNVYHLESGMARVFEYEG
ncbi:multicopper oxidase family protein [Salinilacihabitans rarus]|uniref:multicopper oxidase family protein n=1 Tax=Salinilacihabitans rarus TaxID=2961596 RepID=UPI00272BDB47|nr:multicopper oxidase family protein [Salinilacihabitans rarus]